MGTPVLPSFTPRNSQSSLALPDNNPAVVHRPPGPPTVTMISSHNAKGFNNASRRVVSATTAVDRDGGSSLMMLRSDTPEAPGRGGNHRSPRGRGRFGMSSIGDAESSLREWTSILIGVGEHSVEAEGGDATSGHGDGSKLTDTSPPRYGKRRVSRRRSASFSAPPRSSQVNRGGEFRDKQLYQAEHAIRSFCDPSEVARRTRNLYDVYGGAGFADGVRREGRHETQASIRAATIKALIMKKTSRFLCQGFFLSHTLM